MKRKTTIIVSGLMILCLAVMAAMAGAAGAADVPQVTYVTNSADFGVPFAVMGDDLDKATEVWIWAPGDDKAEARAADDLDKQPALPAVPVPEAVKGVIVSHPNPHMLIVKESGENEFVCATVEPRVGWLKSAAGFSRPFMINRPELYFASTDRAVPGQQIGLYGIDLGKEGLVLFRNVATGAVRQGVFIPGYSQGRPFKNANAWDVKLPDDIAPGRYQIMVHSLKGGPAFWSNRLEIAVTPDISLVRMMSLPICYDVSTPKYVLNKAYTYRTLDGAVAAANSASPQAFTAWLQKEIDAMASAGGGVLTLPTGLFYINSPIRVRSGVVLQGSGMNATEIQVRPDVPLQGGSSMIELTSGSGLQDMAVTVGNGVRNVVLAAYPTGASDPIFINRCRLTNKQKLNTVNGAYPNGVEVTGTSKYFTMIGNEVVAGAPLLMSYTGALKLSTPHRYAYIEGNKFKSYPNNNCQNPFIMKQIAECVIQYNEVSDGVRGFINQAGMFNCYLYNNRFDNIGGVGNGVENMLSENPCDYIEKKVVRAEGSNVVFDAPIEAARGGVLAAGAVSLKSIPYYLYVVTGKGTGQFRKVVDNPTATSFVVDEPWSVVPDASSRLALIYGGTVRSIWSNNLLNNTRGCLSPMYGQGFENTLKGNDFYNAGEIMIWASTSVTSLQAFNFISDNLLRSSNCLNVYNTGMTVNDGQAPGFENGSMFANTYTRNQIIDPVPVALNQYKNTWEIDVDTFSGIRVIGATNNIFAGNYVCGAPNGISQSKCRGNVFYKNKMDRISGARMVLADSTCDYMVPFLKEEAYVPKIVPPRAAPALGTVFTYAGATPAGEVNIALGKDVTTSFPCAAEERKLLTNGDAVPGALVFGTLVGPSYVQVDLGGSFSISRIRLWHHYRDRRAYYNVIVQVSDSPDFSKAVTVFNNDFDNSSGQGAGKDPEYVENANGLDLRFKAVKARYIRSWLDGNSTNTYVHWGELQAFESAAAAGR